LKTLLKRLSKEIEKVSKFQAGTEIQGQFNCLDNCYFDGKIEGDIKIYNKLVLGENALVIGNVYAKNLIVNGRVIGDIFVENKAVFSESSNVRANILSIQLLEVKNGAVLNVDNLIMKSTGRITGKLFAKNIISVNNTNHISEM